MKKAFIIFTWLTVLALCLMVMFDLIFFIGGGPEETLSYEFWVLARQYPVVPFILGFLMGHLTWQYSPDNIKPS